MSARKNPLSPEAEERLRALEDAPPSPPKGVSPEEWCAQLRKRRQELIEINSDPRLRDYVRRLRRYIAERVALDPRLVSGTELAEAEAQLRMDAETRADPRYQALRERSRRLFWKRRREDAWRQMLRDLRARGKRKAERRRTKAELLAIKKKRTAKEDGELRLYLGPWMFWRDAVVKQKSPGGGRPRIVVDRYRAREKFLRAAREKELRPQRARQARLDTGAFEAVKKAACEVRLTADQFGSAQAGKRLIHARLSAPWEKTAALDALGSYWRRRKKKPPTKRDNAAKILRRLKVFTVARR